ncbi:hypothetical protein B0H94_102165 [Salsuginibacillus halophilus]|uniref:Uncharacterized protein n=1 Tax=Salsuginibacillus halophilus TaxID=517424 RepID=A0A2P8HXF7_9BACI|nr:hypothetical protein [Salsuginibacillus halophilus]PSL50888.1 hypothetical protein B0H94_102165 [Salsuginibacillus halophilus]
MGHIYQKPRWIYWKQTFRSKFQAGCVKAKLEDNWSGGYELAPCVEIRRLKSDKYIVRYTYDEA